MSVVVPFVQVRPPKVVGGRVQVLVLVLFHELVPEREQFKEQADHGPQADHPPSGVNQNGNM